MGNLAVLLFEFLMGGEIMPRLAIEEDTFRVGEVKDTSLSIVMVLTSHTELLATSYDDSAYRLRLTNLSPFLLVGGVVL